MRAFAKNWPWIFFLALAVVLPNIRFSQIDNPTRIQPPVDIPIPADVAEFLKGLGNAYGSPNSFMVADYLASDFLDNGLGKFTFLEQLKIHQKFLGKLEIHPLAFQAGSGIAQLTAYASSPIGILNPSLQLLPLNAGATLVKQNGKWKLHGNQQKDELPLLRKFAKISADFVPADLGVYKSRIPTGYQMPVEPLVRISVSHYSATQSPLMPSRSAELSILVERKNEIFWYPLTMPETDWLAVEAGKTVGFPKVLLDIDVVSSFTDYWDAEIKNRDKEIVNISFRPDSDALAHVRPSADAWLVFDKNSMPLKAATMFLERPTSHKKKYGWLTVSAPFSPWKDLIRPGSRAAGIVEEFTSGFKLNLFTQADEVPIPLCVRQMLARNAKAWADSDMPGVLADYHSDFKYNGMDRDDFSTFLYTKLFGATRLWEWKITSFRKSGNTAQIDAVVRTSFGEIPVTMQLIQEDERWFFYGNQV